MREDNPTIELRAGEELDIAASETYLKRIIPGLSGKLRVKQFARGNSNLTYLITFDNKQMVLRRPPSGKKPESGHDMSREFNIISAIRGAYPSVPEVYHHTEDTSVIGSEFYVMEFVPGRVLKGAMPAEYNQTPDDNRRFCQAVWDKLIELHQLDYRALGLGSMGKPDGYIQRQILGWNKRYVDAKTPDVPDCAEIRKWLEENMPPKENGAAIIHGDFRIDNLILSSDNLCDIKAVLDWELSTVGDPLMDLGNSLAYWVEAGDPPNRHAVKPQPSDAPGMFTRREILDYYGERTGLDVSNFNFYWVYGLFRNAAILQQIYYRYYHGQTKNESFAHLGQSVTNAEKYCLRIIECSSL